VCEGEEVKVRWVEETVEPSKVKSSQMNNSDPVQSKPRGDGREEMEQKRREEEEKEGGGERRAAAARSRGSETGR
jgi:hypothetical protein